MVDVSRELQAGSSKAPVKEVIEPLNNNSGRAEESTLTKTVGEEVLDAYIAPIAIRKVRSSAVVRSDEPK